MKFKIGDKVRIKEDLSQCKFGGSTYMNEYAGKEATVTETYDSGLIQLDIDDGEWNWSEGVLELIEDSEKKMRRIDYVLNAKDPIKVLVEEFDLKLNCGVCPGVNCDCEESCGYYLKQYLEQEIEVNESDLKNVEISKEVEDKKNCKDCDYFVKSSLGNYCDFYGILLNIMHGCNEFQLKKHKEGVENIENDQINPFMEEYKKIVTDTMELCIAKNKDYGSSVQDTYERFGDASYLVRITDKYNRICSLLDKEAEVKDESIDDTIRDMANYCFLWLASRRLKEKGDKVE